MLATIRRLLDRRLIRGKSLSIEAKNVLMADPKATTLDVAAVRRWFRKVRREVQSHPEIDPRRRSLGQFLVLSRAVRGWDPAMGRFELALAVLAYEEKLEFRVTAPVESILVRLTTELERESASCWGRALAKLREGSWSEEQVVHLGIHKAAKTDLRPRGRMLQHGVNNITPRYLDGLRRGTRRRAPRVRK